MAWFDPLNNSGGVPFDFFDFTYLSIPPIIEVEDKRYIQSESLVQYMIRGV